MSHGVATAERTKWQLHPNFGGPASMLLGVHDHFRLGSRRLLQLLVAAPPDLAHASRAFRPLAEMLHHHHHAEEAMLFPLIRRRTGAAPERLVTDHETLTAAIAYLSARLSKSDDANEAKAAAESFDQILVEHLAREESLVMPVLLEMTASEAWAGIHAGD